MKTENRQTHLLSLWLDNDEGTYEQVRQIVADTLERTPPRHWIASGLSAGEWHRHEVAEVLESWIRGMSDELDIPGMFRDLMESAIGQVEFADLAREYIEAYESSDEPEESA